MKTEPQGGLPLTDTAETQTYMLKFEVFAPVAILPFLKTTPYSSLFPQPSSDWLFQ